MQLMPNIASILKARDFARCSKAGSQRNLDAQEGDFCLSFRYRCIEAARASARAYGQASGPNSPWPHDTISRQCAREGAQVQREGVGIAPASLGIVGSRGRSVGGRLGPVGLLVGKWQGASSRLAPCGDRGASVPRQEAGRTDRRQPARTPITRAVSPESSTRKRRPSVLGPTSVVT